MNFTLGAAVNAETLALAGAYARLRGPTAEVAGADIADAAMDRTSYLQERGHDIGSADRAVDDPDALSLLYGAMAARRGLNTGRLAPRVQSDAEEVIDILRERGFGVVQWSAAK